MDPDKRFLLTCTLGLFAIVVLLMSWSFVYDSRTKFLTGTISSLLSEDSNQPRLPPLRPSDPVTGSSDPKAITITVFSDFNCPYCRLSAGEMIRAVTELKHPVRVIWKDLPISGSSREAMTNALAGRCAHAQKKFWELHDAVLTLKVVNETTLKEAAARLDLDVPAFNSCLQESKYLLDIQKDVAVAREHLITSTPTFFVGNQSAVSGYVSSHQFRRLIEKARAP